MPKELRVNNGRESGFAVFVEEEIGFVEYGGTRHPVNAAMELIADHVARCTGIDSGRSSEDSAAFEARYSFPGPDADQIMRVTVKSEVIH